MSDPNKALGKWLICDVLKLKYEQILTIQILKKYGIDSVRIDKIDEQNYEFHFATPYNYDSFIQDLK